MKKNQIELLNFKICNEIGRQKVDLCKLKEEVMNRDTYLTSYLDVSTERQRNGTMSELLERHGEHVNMSEKVKECHQSPKGRE